MNAFLTQALGVALVVSALLTLTRRGGTVVAGIATAAISLPTLALLALQEGRAFALLAAAGTLLSTPMCMALAALGLRWLARETAPGSPVRRAQAWRTALLAGLMSAGVCAGAHELGAWGSGFVGGLPVVAAWTMLGTCRHSGSVAAARYVCAYRRGLRLRAVVLLVFAATVLPLGAAWAMLLALAAGGCVAWVAALRTAVPSPCR